MSKKILFTYIWQTIMAALAIGSLSLAVAFIAWGVGPILVATMFINTGTFVLQFAIGGLWRRNYRLEDA